MAVRDVLSAYRCRRCRKVFCDWWKCSAHADTCKGTKHQLKYKPLKKKIKKNEEGSLESS